MNYHYDVPGIVIWLTHILIGIFFIYTGYQIVQKKPLNQLTGITFIVLGCMAFLYHLHLMIFAK
jgi:hypothetical protein